MFGEAAKGVPDAIRSRASEVDWRRIVRLRDFLAHGYANIEPDELWEVVTVNLAADVPVLERLQRELEAELGGSAQ